MTSQKINTTMVTADFCTRAVDTGLGSHVVFDGDAMFMGVIYERRGIFYPEYVDYDDGITILERTSSLESAIEALEKHENEVFQKRYGRSRIHVVKPESASK